MTHQIAIISGKGGTGKTTLTAVLARLAKGAVFADCDVDAPNMSILLNAEMREEIPFFGGKEYEIQDQTCIKCGMCKEVCEFDAVEGEYFINQYRCEGCGVCHYFCPAESIKVSNRFSGHYYESYTPWGTFIHARLKPGEEKAVPIMIYPKKTIKEGVYEIDTKIMTHVENYTKTDKIYSLKTELRVIKR